VRPLVDRITITEASSGAALVFCDSSSGRGLDSTRRPWILCSLCRPPLRFYIYYALATSLFIALAIQSPVLRRPRFAMSNDGDGEYQLLFGGVITQERVALCKPQFWTDEPSDYIFLLYLCGWLIVVKLRIPVKARLYSGESGVLMFVLGGLALTVRGQHRSEWVAPERYEAGVGLGPLRQVRGEQCPPWL
jgi:hypothetical protein